ncbi:MAG: hypothetical protein PHI93_07925 [Kiritimatiellae bacterium]|nr:hypothetical protein [Kiritimatiellia bacterium]
MNKALIFCGCVLLATWAWATPPNVPVLDGQPLEYDATDLRGSFVGPATWGANGTLSNLYVTWDATYLYIALQAWQADNNKLVVLIDVDPDAGTGATTTTNWTSIEPSYIQYNDYGWTDGSGSFGLDYMLASEGFYNNAIRISYDGIALPSTNNTDSLFDAGNGATPIGTPVDMASVNNTTVCPHKGFEARIPWGVLYHTNRFGTVEPGETVPRGAALRLLAGIHNNDPASAWSSPDTIPNQAVADYTNGIVTAATYLDVLVDADTNGIPDMLSGDVNAPWIRTASAALGGSNIYVAFNEPVTPGSAANTMNWLVGTGFARPTSATAQCPQSVLLGLSEPLSTNYVPLISTGVEDAAANSRDVEFCLFPAESAIPQFVEVTFVVNTDSGMGSSASHATPSAFFVNGNALPLEWGYPPLGSTPLVPIPGSNGWASATVTFPPGTPADIFYKYSGRIDNTNTYEAIRLTEFADTARPLALSTNDSFITVRDYLGPAAAPLRNPGDTNEPTAHNRLYQDMRRGDAGVRVRRDILFQLDLSMRNTNDLTRVMVLGSDPLRGFNDTGETGGNPAQDYPDASVYVAWSNAGIQLVDDGTLGDAVAGDGIYSHLWAFSTNGIDAAIEPGDPYSLVGGRKSVYFPEEIPGTEPYLGNTWWQARRSPRSMIYKFFVLTAGNTSYQSPTHNLDYYVADPEGTAQIVLTPWVWDNENIPPPPPSNAPALTGVSLTGTTASVQFENVLTEGAHGVRISTNLLNNQFDDYGHRATPASTNGGVRQWSAAIAQASDAKEFYTPYAGPEPNPTPTYWEPNADIPVGATTVRVYFCQFLSNLSGKRSMTLTGTFRTPTWDEGQPMQFIGDGTWMTDIVLPASVDGAGVKFKPRGGPTNDWYTTGGDFQFVRGSGGVTMAPMPPVPGSPFTITLDAAGTPLAASSNIYLHMGFDNWQDELHPRPAMTNTAGTTWEYTFEVSSNYSHSIDFVFTDAAGTTWYSEGNWHAFMAPYYNAP